MDDQGGCSGGTGVDLAGFVLTDQSQNEMNLMDNSLIRIAQRGSNFNLTDRMNSLNSSPDDHQLDSDRAKHKEMKQY